MSAATEWPVDDLAWLVGICEGEATFDTCKGYPRIRVGMTDRDVCGRVADMFGCSLRLSLRKAPANPVWCAEITGARAEEIMRVLLPHMGARRSARIAQVLAVAEFRRQPERSSIPGPAAKRPMAIASYNGGSK